MLKTEDKTRVMIVDDSVLVRKYLSQILSDIGMEVVATASDGKIGLQKMLLYSPDVVVLDIEMPEMNGIDFLKYIKTNPPPKIPKVIMFSSLLEEGSSAVFDALTYGASELIKKPDGNIQDNINYLKNEFNYKINGLLSRKDVLSESKIEKIETKKDYAVGLNEFDRVFENKRVKPELVAIGSSTGGPVALRRIIKDLDNLPVPLVIAQHMPPGFTLEFAKNLEHSFNRMVKELNNEDKLEAGVIYICPGGKHAKLVKIDNSIVFKEDNNEYEGFFFKPSVDIFFKSIRQYVSTDILAIILTGMGKDGAAECVSLKKAGAFVIAQDELSSAVWGMPGNAVKMGGVDVVLNVEEIGLAINRFFK
ncbi:MAG: chemotaxis-specific protein-glutamate methyltransferase CheB [Brevinematales bacterium]|nr:chemotaxis-specific protein-glutamate methyltransferase CheB [Brevinematales bacterium]